MLNTLAVHTRAKRAEQNVLEDSFLSYLLASLAGSVGCAIMMKPNKAKIAVYSCHRVMFLCAGMRTAMAAPLG